MFKLLQTAFALFVAVSPSVAVSVQSQKRTNDPQCYYSGSSKRLVERAAPTLSFSNSQWIWTSELSGGNAPPGSRAFRKTFEAPEGKTADLLTIAFAVDNVGTLWVNGQEIITEDGWNTAGTYCVSLSEYPCLYGLNVIAFNATNLADVPNPAGLLVDAVIAYSDGSTSPLVSDTTWRASTTVPNGFQELSFDDSTWAAAVSEGVYPQAPWNTVTLATDPITFAPASWIWTNEVSGGNAPGGARALRTTTTLPQGHTSASATIIITVDNEYSLYVNGRFVGSGNNFQVAQKYVVNNIQGPEVVFAVYAVNDLTVANPAGLLASIQITSQADGNYCSQDCSSTSYLVTDPAGAWKALPGAVPAGFEQPGFDDSQWPAALVEGNYGVAPWQSVPVPTTVTTGGTPLPGAPAGSA